MKIREPGPSDETQVREEWQRAVEDLMDEVQSWAQAQDWKTERVLHILEEPGLGRYTVPGLEIETPRGRLELEPVGRDILGAEGRVDFSVWPTLYRVLLLRSPDGKWFVRTEFGPKWPKPWGPTTFVELAEALLDER